jgi:hypothetical protein
MFNLEKIYERHSFENSAIINVSWGAGRIIGVQMAKKKMKLQNKGIKSYLTHPFDDILIGITSTPSKWKYH